MDLTLIPFGLSLVNNTLVDVYEVASGKNCGCICPSCKLPLIARHGTVKVWHFAHDTRDMPRHLIKECNYSFFVSIRMMARQLISGNLEIRLPACGGVCTELVSVAGEEISVPFQASHAQTIKLSEVVTDAAVSGVWVDILGNIKGHTFALFFTYPGRSVPTRLRRPDTEKLGIVALSLQPLLSRFKQKDGSTETYKSILTRYISEETIAKSWVYHPRFRQRQEIAQATARREACKISSAIPLPVRPVRRYSGTPAKPAVDRQHAKAVKRRPLMRKLNCLLCGRSWEAPDQPDLRCPGCGQRGSISRQ
jgi:hypothetical protein